MFEATDVRDALVTYTSDGPPPAFTLDDVRAAGHRGRRRRHALVAVAAAVTVVTGATVTAVNLTADPEIHAVTRTGPDPAPYCRAAEAAGPLPSSAPIRIENPWNGYPLRVTTEPTARAADRLSCFWAGTVTGLLPGATFGSYYPPDSEPLRLYPQPLPNSETGQKRGFSYFAKTVVEDESGRAMLDIRISATGQSAENEIARCRQRPACVVRTGPGDRVVTYESGAHSAGQLWASARMQTGDTEVHIGVREFPDNRRPPRTEPLLSGEQLARITEAPELTLFP